jgi:exodeoxyribonuclease-3
VVHDAATAVISVFDWAFIRGFGVFEVVRVYGDALFRLDSRQAFRRVLHQGLTDAVLACDSRGGQYTFWDYQAGAWQKDWGLRIDHILLSPQALARLHGAQIDRQPRNWDKPSDHTPVLVSLDM